MNNSILNHVYTETIVPKQVTPNELLQDLKDYLRITHSFEDSVLNRFISTAVECAETYTGRMFVQRTLRSWFQKMNDRHIGWWSGTKQTAIGVLYDSDVILPCLPVDSVDAIKTYSDADVETIVDSSTYRIANQDLDFWTVIRLTEGSTWPTDLRNLNAFAVEYVCGLAVTAANLPEPVKQAIVMVAAFMYTNRGCASEKAFQDSGAKYYLDKFRVMKL